ncbi:hypothetical protein OPIT5_27020 [Opitutaceae bacterium TAV5]|nr:hypothetical protein OPIT5_27020 [Opitutaceae bacterium TAV5]
MPLLFLTEKCMPGRKPWRHASCMPSPGHPGRRGRQSQVINRKPKITTW